MTKRKNGEIEFLRFLFSLIIVVHHSRNIVGDENSFFLRGSFAVEFFFIVSGYLMMSQVQKLKKTSKEKRIGKETGLYVLHKAAIIFPSAFISFVVSIPFVLITSMASLKETIEALIDSFFSDVLFLHMTGISPVIYNNSINGPLWYVSSMLLCMLILYPLLIKYQDIMVYIFAPLSILFILGYLWKTDGTILDPTHWMGVIYKGNLRAFAELEIGVLCYCITTKLRMKCFKRIVQGIITIVKWASYLFVIVWMFIAKGQLELPCLILLAIGISLSFSQQCLDTNLFNNKICLLLGQWSLLLYMNHFYYTSDIPLMANLKYLLPESYTFSTKIIIYIIIVVVTVIIVQIIKNIITQLKLRRIRI